MLLFDRKIFIFYYYYINSGCSGCGNLYRRERKKRGRVKLSGQAADRQGGSGGWSDGDTSLHNGSGNYSGGSCGSGGQGNNYGGTGSAGTAGASINFSSFAGAKRHHTSDSDGSDDDFSTRAVHFIVSPTLMSTLNNDHTLITEKSKVSDFCQICIFFFKHIISFFGKFWNNHNVCR